MAGLWTSGALVLLGLGLIALYVLGARVLPQGVQEFAYYPAYFDAWPFGPMRGFTVEQAARHLGWVLLLGPGLLALGLGLSGSPGLRPLTLPSGARLARVAGLLGGALSALFLFGVLRGRALVDDELTYATQADLLLRGRLGDPGLPDIGVEGFSIWTAQGWTGKYLFGEPLLQALGAAVGWPALPHLGLYALLLVLYYAAVKAEAGEAVAGWSAALLALSPMLVITTATGLSHTAALTALTGAGLGWVWVRQGRTTRGAAAVALGVGLGLWIRPQTAAMFGAPLVVWTVLALLRGRRWGALGLAAALGAACLGAVGAYNQALTGSPWTLPWALQAAPEGYGFVTLFGSYTHTPLRGIENTLSQLVRLNQWAFGWPLSLGVIALWRRTGAPRAGVGTWGWPALASVLFLFGYYSPGISDTGPIYWFEVLLPLAVLGGHAVVGALQRWPQVTPAVLAVHLILGTGGFTLEQGARLHRLTSAVHDDLEAALAPFPRPLLVLYEVRDAETLRIGWLMSRFPIRQHAGDLLTLPALTFFQDADKGRALMAGRACVYARANPRTARWEAMPCADARDWIGRPWAETRPLAPVPTAVRLGWLPPPPWIQSRSPTETEGL